MVKKRKKQRKPKKRKPAPGRGPRAKGGSPGRRSEADSPSASDGEDGLPAGGFSARSLLLDSVREGSPEEGEDSSEAGPPGPAEAPEADELEPAREAGDWNDDEYEEEEEEEEEDKEGRREPAGADDELDELGDDEEDDEEVTATQLGATRYVVAGFFALWLVTGYIAGRILEGLWSYLATKDFFANNLPALAAVPYEKELISRRSVSLVLGALIAGIVVYLYYRKPRIKQWADEVAEQMGKVTWPTRKDVSNNTVVVIAVSAVLTTYLSLLDKFWGFVTNMFYSSGL